MLFCSSGSPRSFIYLGLVGFLAPAAFIHSKNTMCGLNIQKSSLYYDCSLIFLFNVETKQRFKVHNFVLDLLLWPFTCTGRTLTVLSKIDPDCSKIIWRKKLNIFLVGSSQSQCADQSNHREHHHLKETTICFFLPFFPSSISSYASLLHQQQQKPQARCLDKNGPLLRSFEWCMVPVVV